MPLGVACRGAYFFACPQLFVPEEFRTQGLGTGEKVIFARNTGCIQTGLATKNILEEVDVGKSGNSSSPLSDWQLRTKIALGSRGLSSFCTSH
ncbi:hypothetical protein CUMW_225950 [Citrus unshiu]|uniref:Uncharacterized protein n=1 Tax=Citrus unshiu TaxID=55188 RepID=A0A2H5QFS9_CITUN|nr:hypothetical protein CUMW_225950 [Citrus unshiu]